jgi:exonuclease VII small subunit
MTTDASIAKQVIQDEIKSQMNSAKAELEVLAGRAEGTLLKAGVEAYETLMTKLQAIQQKLQELKESTGDQWQQTKVHLEALISDFKESVEDIASAAKTNQSRGVS